jgi:hypothetical protein
MKERKVGKEPFGPIEVLRDPPLTEEHQTQDTPDTTPDSDSFFEDVLERVVSGFIIKGATKAFEYVKNRFSKPVPEAAKKEEDKEEAKKE